ncbi:MAG: AtpZ/AtpI family protein [Planctomycetota bacterium]
MADDVPRPLDTKTTAVDAETSAKRKAERSEQDAAEARKEAGLLGLGLQLTLTVVAFMSLGWWGDQHWGWAPWGRQGLGFLGIVVGLYFFVKEATK